MTFSFISCICHAIPVPEAPKSASCRSAIGWSFPVLRYGDVPGIRFVLRGRVWRKIPQSFCLLQRQFQVGEGRGAVSFFEELAACPVLHSRLLHGYRTEYRLHLFLPSNGSAIVSGLWFVLPWH